MTTNYTNGGRELPARYDYDCADCGGNIPKGTLYFNYTSDSSGDGKVGPWQGRRHLDCNYPWHLPTEVSPTRRLAGLRKGTTRRYSEGFSIILNQTAFGGEVTWKLPTSSLLAIAVGQQTPQLQSDIHDEIAMGFQALAAAYLTAAGNPRVMRKVGIQVRALRALGPDIPQSSD